MPSLYKELMDILNGEKLTPYFQPIVSLTKKKIIGYEALIRGPSNSSLHSAFSLFNAAQGFNLTTRLEFICRELIIKRYVKLGLTEKLFINVSPAALLEPDFKHSMTLKLLDKFAVNFQSIVIELTEHQPTDNYEGSLGLHMANEHNKNKLL